MSNAHAQIVRMEARRSAVQARRDETALWSLTYAHSVDGFEAAWANLAAAPVPDLMAAAAGVLADVIEAVTYGSATDVVSALSMTAAADIVAALEPVIVASIPVERQDRLRASITPRVAAIVTNEALRRLPRLPRHVGLAS